VGYIYLMPSKTQTFECKACSYSTTKASNWRKHLQTRKHADLTGTTADDPSLVCECGRVYRHRQSLHTHRKRCNKQVTPPVDSGMDQLQAMTDRLADTMREMTKGIADLANNAGGTRVTNHFSGNNIVVGNQNTNISINLFLNEHCKDAMTIQSFVKQLALTISDLEHGKGDVVANALVQNLRPLNVTERPVHCTDGAGQWFVKDEKKGWEENDGTTVIEKSEEALVKRWTSDFEAEHPGWIANERLQDKYVSMSSTMLSELSNKEKEDLLGKVGETVKLPEALGTKTG
jgi:hypothetical protein